MLEPIVTTSVSIAEVMRKLGLRIGGASHKHLKNSIDKFGIDRSHFNNGGQIAAIQTKKEWFEILIVGKKIRSVRLREALLASGRKLVCEKCGCGSEWNNESLTLQIDHKDGDDTNNLPSNLRFMCPNCHSQTPTFAKIKCPTARRCACGQKSPSGRCVQCYNGQRASHIPAKEELREMVWQHPTTMIAKQFGVSDHTISKWCKKHGLVKPGKGYWRKKHADVV